MRHLEKPLSMKEQFTISQFKEIAKTENLYFRKYFKKNNERVSVNDIICVIRCGNYNSPFRYSLIPLKSPKSGYLNFTKCIDEPIIESDFLFEINDEKQLDKKLLLGQKFEHIFSGDGSSYVFLKWLQPNDSYVEINQPVYAFSFIDESFLIHYAERSGRLKFSELIHNFLFKDKLLYSIEYSEPFEKESGFVQDNASECYLYLMKDTANDFYKIGISNLPKYREKTLQSEKPTIELIIAKRFPMRLIAQSFEKALHKSFEGKRIRGEWFKLELIEVEKIIESLK